MAKAAAALRGLVLLAALAGAFGCHSKSSGDTHSKSQAPSPTSTATISPPKPIPAKSLPFAEDELNVAAAFPAPNEERVALVSPISLTFDAPLLAGQSLTDAIRVSSSAHEVVGSISLSTGDTLIFRPADMWQPSTHYAIDINPNLMSADGLLVNGELRWEFLTVADVHTTPQDILDLCMSDLDVEMLAAVNQARIIARSCDTTFYAATGKLSWSCLLQEAALTHSQDMANLDSFSHQGSDGSTFAQRILRTGYPARLVGENLAYGYTTVAEAMVGWLNSPEHCRTLMTPELTEFGFGRTVGANNHQYWTQNFARPTD